MVEAMSFFVAGGTVPPGAPSYVARSADGELYEALLAGEFCYVLNTRQMGKSSLAVRTVGRLAEAGVRTAFVDLTRLGATGADPERWYTGLLMELGRAAGLRSEAMAYVKANPGLTPSGRLFGFLADEVIPRADAPLVIFVDEVDATRTLPFSADDLFAGIRQAWNARAEDPRYARLTFCLMGAALPSDLIRDPRITPFNVGRRVELRDFTPTEAAPFAEALGDATLARLLHWTGGHPFLTQALGAELSSPSSSGSPWRGGRGERNEADVDALVRARYLDARARESDTNLADVGNRLLGTGDPDVTDAVRADTLSLYDAMLRGKPVADDEANPAAVRIKMSGVARVEGGNLKIRNRIYAGAFGREWVRENMPGGELRRQKKAFWKGAIRTGLVAGTVLAVVSALAVIATDNARKARVAERRANVQSGLAEERAREAGRQTVFATAAKEAAVKSAAALRKALIRQRELGDKATAAAARATASARVADEQRGFADVQKGIALRNARTASDNAKEANRQKENAERQTRLVLAGQKSLRAELYDNAIQSLQPLWERGDRVEMAKVLAAAPMPKDRGWEWGYWRRLSKNAYVSRNDSAHKLVSSFSVSTLTPSGGSGIIRYSGQGGWADLVDDRTGKIRNLWRLPSRVGRNDDPYRMAFSRNGRWAVRDDAKRRLVLQDLARGTTRPLAATKINLVDGVSDDGGRYVTQEFENGEGREVTIWDSAGGRLLFVRRPPPSLDRAFALLPDGRTLLMSYREELTDRRGIAEYDVERNAIGTVYMLPPFVGSRRRSIGLEFASADSMVVRVQDKISVFRRGEPEPRFVLTSVSLGRGGFWGGLSASRDGGLLLASPRSLQQGDPVSEIWDLRNGSLLAKIPHFGGILSGDGRRILSLRSEDVRGFDWREALPYREATILRVRRAPPTVSGGPPPSGKSEVFDELSLDDGSVLSMACQWNTTTKDGRTSSQRSTLSYTRFDREGRVLARYPSVGEIPASEGAYDIGNYLLIAKGRRFEVRRLRDFRLVRTIEIQAGDFPVVSPDALRVLSLDARGVLRAWTDAAAPVSKVQTRFSTSSDETDSLPSYELSPDGTKVLVSDQTKGFEIREFPSLRLLTSVGGERDLSWGTWVDPSTIQFDNGITGGTVLYDVATKKSRPGPPTTFQKPSSLSPDRRLRAEVVGGGTIEIRSTRSDRRLFTLDAAAEAPAENAPATTIAGFQFSKDGRSLDVLYSDGRLRTYRGDF